MPGLPSRPHDQRQTIARGSFFSSHQRHFMIDRVPIQLGRSNNSRLSSPSSGVVRQHAKPFAVSQARHIWPRASPPKTAHYSAPCSFLSLPTTRPLDLAPQSPIKTHNTPTLQRFSPIHFLLTGAARLRFLSAHAYRRRAAELKMLCIMLNGIEAMRDAPGELIITPQLTEDGHVLVSVRDTG